MAKFEELRILRDCELLVRIILRYTNDHPKWNYTINSQIIRSSLSVGSNLAEGSRKTGKDRLRFYDIALASMDECKFQLRFYTKDDDDLFDLINKISGTIVNLKKTHKAQTSNR